MKKSLFLIFLLILTIILIGCGDGDAEDTTAEDSTAVSADTQTETVAETDVETEPETTVEDTTAEETTVEETTIPDVPRQEPLDAEYAADFTVSNAFSSDMVVQRNEHIRVWGWADESENGKKVSGEFMNMFAEALVENGEWVLTFTARQEANANPGNTMKIYTDKKTVEFHDVLIGDVFLVMGQSNCQYSVATHWQYCNNEAQGGWKWLDFDAPIRLNYNSFTITDGYPQMGTTETVRDVKDNGGWTKAEKSMLYNFTAIGYFSAVNYLKLTDGKIPVGIIEVEANGMPIGTFLCNEVADKCKTDTLRTDMPGVYWTTGANPNGNPGRFVYNHYIYPFERYAIAGIIWYQGESDCYENEARRYAQVFTELMTYMRGTHNIINRDFPVVMLEFPSIYEGKNKDNFYMDVGVIRGVIGTIPGILPNSYVSISSDLWSDPDYPNSLHPNCKYEQSERVAAILAYTIEGKNQLEKVTGPVAVSCEFGEDRKSATVTFINVGEGLTTLDGGTAVKGFNPLRRNLSVNTSAKVTAEIVAPNQIRFTSSQGIAGVGYNVVTSHFFGKELNLVNSYGFPASAFAFFTE